MTIRKIADLPTVCRHPEHNVPSHICLPNGVYAHECPACKATVVFTVNRPTLGAGQIVDLVDNSFENALRDFVASEMHNPNSPISKAMSRNFTMSRRRG